MRYYKDMNELYVALILAGVALLFRALASAYFFLAPYELRRRSSRGKAVFRKLYQVVQYGNVSQYSLQFVALLSALSSVILVGQRKPFLFTLAYGLLIALSLLVVAKLRLRWMVRFAAWIAPRIAPIMRVLNQIVLQTLAVVTKARRGKRPAVITDLYTKEDLENLLLRQKEALNNRIDVVELDNALQSLDFHHKKVKEFMTPRKAVKFVRAKEPIGPILMSELHKTGHKKFPVRGNSRNEVLGMLELAQITELVEGGSVADAMSKTAVFIREDNTLLEALTAYIQTGCDTFVVVTMREQVVGMITVKQILAVLFGSGLDTDFDAYDDLEAVAHAGKNS